MSALAAGAVAVVVGHSLGPGGAGRTSRSRRPAPPHAVEGGAEDAPSTPVAEDGA